MPLCANLCPTELLEDPSAAEEPLVEGVTFQVKYLGQCSVENDSAEDETAAAIKDIITTVHKKWNFSVLRTLF